MTKDPTAAIGDTPACLAMTGSLVLSRGGRSEHQDEHVAHGEAHSDLVTRGEPRGEGRAARRVGKPLKNAGSSRRILGDRAADLGSGTGPGAGLVPRQSGSD